MIIDDDAFRTKGSNRNLRKVCPQDSRNYSNGPCSFLMERHLMVTLFTTTDGKKVIQSRKS
jgi:hypothetical protein